MKHTIKIRTIASLAVAALLTSGCATMSEAEREEREYRRVDFRNKFIEDRSRCEASGGRLYVQGYGGTLDKHGVPRSRVWYTCS